MQEVFKQIPEPRRPHNGDTDIAAEAVLPVLEFAFDMPAAGPRRGSEKWLAQLVNNPFQIAFAEMVEFPRLIRAYVKNELRNGGEHNLVKLTAQDVIPSVDDLYDGKEVKPSDVLETTRRAMGFHKSLRFLRAGGVNYAIGKLR